jgi:hypothetical protein
VAVGQEQFENPGRQTFAVGTRYQRAGEGQLTKRTKRVCNELHSVRNIVRLQTEIVNCRERCRGNCDCKC